MKFLMIVWLCISSTAFAGEPLFGYLYTTDLQPKNTFEIEQWLTDREGQAQGHFHHLDMRTELEYGITDNFQLSGYLNYMYADEENNSVRGKTEGIEIPYDHDSNKSYRAARFDGISIEATYRVLSPYIDPVGLAFYVEPELGQYESGLEIRGILQKNYFDDTLVLAANAWIEFDREQGTNLVVPGDTSLPDGSWSNATYAEIDFGASYRFISNWSVGLEFRNHNEYAGWTLAQTNQDHSAFFLGPNIHYATQKWFMNFSVLRQLGTIAYNDEQKAEMSHGLLYGNEHTAWDGIRLIVGFPL
jgi:hypothetical protein